MMAFGVPRKLSFGGICILALVLVHQSELVNSFGSLQGIHRKIQSLPTKGALLATDEPHHDDDDATATTTTTTTTTKDEEETIELARNRLGSYFSFPLDDWQLWAGGEVCRGHNVVVCAPTGAGKTVVGEMALYVALEEGCRAIYTTPLKALSNQKYAELRESFGKATVGLSTGDISIHRDAKLRVMTTEVYRNMAWRSSGGGGGGGDGPLDHNIMLDDNLSDTAVVVLDEFHYMGQPGRGGVWEESVITTPGHTQIVALSATLPNALQLANWMESVTGRRTVLVQAGGKRPVPLRYLFATKKGLYPLFRDPDAGPGAPHGLLGLRGDGLPQQLYNNNNNNNKKKKGFGAKDQDNDPSDKIPRGLQVNPALKTLARKRVQRVDNSMERLKARALMEGGDAQQDNDEYNKNGWRPRGRDRLVRRGGPLSPREERRERDRLLRNEMKKSVPSLSLLLKRLEQRDLLPAIMFLFSRAGCDTAASTVCRRMSGPPDPNRLLEDDFDDDDTDNNNGSQKPKRKTRQRSQRYQDRKNGLIGDSDGRSFRKGSNYVDDDVLESVLDGPSRSNGNVVIEAGSPLSSENWAYYSKAGLLSYDQIQEVASRVAAFNKDNAEIAFDQDVAQQFLFGVGAHHAGMLPAHKAFVETLYRAQLMKAVFATETLAAGINMPARTTCICNMAKRGEGGSINLLETSNLLQMAGRAGRRGMDSDGTCVLLATPFEAEDEAAQILTSHIQPVQSQFAPSYALAVNLIGRGQGKLDVAKQLVEKSFALWEKRRLDQELAGATQDLEGDEGALDQATAAHVFMASVCDAFRWVLEEGDETDTDDLKNELQLQIELLEDRKLLKIASKSYIGMVKQLEVHRAILSQLESDLESMDADPDLAAAAAEEEEEDRSNLVAQIEAQKEILFDLEKRKLAQHVFSSIAKDVNRILSMNGGGGGDKVSLTLKKALADARGKGGSMEDAPLLSDELVLFAKLCVTLKKKQREVRRSTQSAQLLRQANRMVGKATDSTWVDMLNLVKVLVCYGCLETSWNPMDNNNNDYDYQEENSSSSSLSSLEKESFTITLAGEQVGMLSTENTLWSVVAMGGAWDVVGASSELDGFRSRLANFEANFMDDIFDDDDNDADDNDNDDTQKRTTTMTARQEAQELVESLTKLSPNELAGYVACLVSDGYRPRGGAASSLSESFFSLTVGQQQVLQNAMTVSERLVEVQRHCCHNSNNSNNKWLVDLDISQCAVVTAWAGGCSWNEALELSGLAPGDLVRTLGRVLDALRQFGNVPFVPIRRNDNDDGPRGIDARVRKLCREAAVAINRYPVKDPLPFGTAQDEVDNLWQDDDDDNDEEEDDDDD